MANQASDILSLVTVGLAKDPVTTMALLLQADEQLPGAFDLIMLAILLTSPDVLDSALLVLLQLAQSGDSTATLVLQAVSQKMLGSSLLQVTQAKNGAKLSYIKQLLGQCPEGMELTYFKAGGKVCSKCVAAKKKVKKDCNGKKMFKEGGISTLVNNFRTEHMLKCGGKVEKAELGNELNNKNSLKKQILKTTKTNTQLPKTNTLLPKKSSNTGRTYTGSPYKNDKERKLYNESTMGGPKGEMAEGKCGMKIKKTKLSTKKCGGKVSKKKC